MHVLDQHHERPLRNEVGQEPNPSGMQPVAGSQRVKVARDVEAERQPEDLVLAESRTHVVGRVALEDAEVLFQDLREGPERDAVAVRHAAAGAPQRLGLLVGKPFPELAHQACLADAGVALHRDEHRAAAVRCSAISGAAPLQLRVSADERPRKAADASGPHQRERAQHLPAANALGLSLRLDRLCIAELERASRRGDGPLAGEDHPGLRRLFEPRRDVDGVAADERAARARDPGDHLARVHPDAEPETLLLPLHGERGMQCSLGVVLKRLRRTEGGHDRVAGKLLDGPAGRLDLRGHRVVEALEPRARALGILLPGECRRAGEVGEQDGGELSLRAILGHERSLGRSACEGMRPQPLASVAWRR